MADSPGRTASTSLRIATFAVDAVWYVSWALTALAVLAGVLFWCVPGFRGALVKRGALRENASFTLPLEVRYSAIEIRGAFGARAPAGSLELVGHLVGHHDVIMARPFSKADIAGATAYQLLWAAVFLWVLYQLRSLMRTVRQGHPFDPLNPKRIRRIACVIIASGPLYDLAQWLQLAGTFTQAIAVVKQALPAASVGYHVRISWAPVVIGLIILAIAHAFDAGVRLQDDHDLTV
jgi:hypothetical protein